MKNPSDFSDRELMEKYFELREAAQQITADFDAKIKPVNEGMELIENLFRGRFLERAGEIGPANTKTDIGTAYRQRIMKLRIADRQAYLKFVFDNWQTFGNEMLSVGALKEPVAAYIDHEKNKSKLAPPGIEVNYVTNINIRRT